MKITRAQAGGGLAVALIAFAGLTFVSGQFVPPNGGSGTGNVVAQTGGGSANYMTKWSSPYNLANSMVVDNATSLTINPSATANVGEIDRTLDTGGGAWSIVKTLDQIEPTGPNFSWNMSDALNTPKGDGSYDHTQGICWNQGRTIATQPQSCRGNIESHWGDASEMYDTFTGTDNHEHRWIGSTTRWDGTIGSSFFTGTTIAFGDWASPPHTFAQFNGSSSPTTTAASLQLGGLQVGDLGTAFNIVDNDTSNSIMQIGTTTTANKYLSLGSAGTTLQAATNGGAVLTLILQQAGQDAIFTLQNAAGAALSIAQRSGASGTVDMVAGGNNIRCWPGGSGHCQSIGPVDFEDTFGNIQLSFNPTTFIADVESAGMWGWSSTALATGAVDTALARNGAGIVEVNNGTAGAFRDFKARATTFSGAMALSSTFAQSGANTFGTGTGAVSLNGATTVTGTNTFATGTGAVTISGAVTESTNFSQTGATTFSTGTGTVSLNGLAAVGAHIETTGTATTTLSGCGTGSPTISAGSTDNDGKITEGTTATGCTMTFKATYTNSPFCTCTANSAGAAAACDASGSTATSLVIVNASATGDVIVYHCVGRSGGT